MAWLTLTDGGIAALIGTPTERTGVGIVLRAIDYGRRQVVA